MRGLFVALVSIVGAFSLHIFYRAVQFRWPESYVGADDAGVYRLLASPSRYVLFRTVPMFFVCTVVAVSAGRAGLSGALAALGVVALHVGRTNVPAVFRDARRSKVLLRHRLPLVFMSLLGMVGMASAGLLAVVASPYLEPLVPPLRELSNALFTALVAGIAGAYIVRATSNGFSTADLIHLSRERLNDRLWDLTENFAADEGCDSALLRAVMLVENIQRPRWLRRMEYWKATIWPAGTYGVMQVASERPISDEESIRRAARLLAGEVFTNQQGHLDFERISEIARKYNPDPGYPMMLWEALDFVLNR